MNNYEVNQIFRHYITLWEEDQSLNGIHLLSFSSKFSSKYHEIIKAFFKDKDIGYCDYFVFICVFLFFDYDKILQILLAISNIHSNLFITPEQLERFVILIEKDFNVYQQLKFSAINSICKKYII